MHVQNRETNAVVVYVLSVEAVGICGYDGDDDVGGSGDVGSSVGFLRSLTLVF